MKNPDLFPYFFKDEANDFAKKNGETRFYLRSNATGKIQEQYYEFVKPSLESMSYINLRKDAERQGVTFSFTGYKTHCGINANGFLFYCDNYECHIKHAIKVMKFCGIIE
jgi:hypothetical protein